jgi:hypothetical protein
LKFNKNKQDKVRKENNMDEKMKVFAMELCKLLKLHKLNEFRGEFFSGFNNYPALQRYQFSWKSGRHEADVNQIQITYQENHSILLSNE